MIGSKVLALLFVCMVCRGVSAMTDGSCVADSANERTHSIREITIEARRVENAVAAEKPMQTIGMREIEQLGISNVAEAAKRLAGTSVKDYGGIGGMKTVSIRNLGAHHTAVSYDGVAISNTQAGQIDLGRYSLDGVQSLKLSLGESSDMMQSARHLASAGVLAIETERPRFEQGRDYSMRLRVKGGAFGLVNPSLRYWQKLGESTSMAVSGDYIRADGMYSFTLRNGSQQSSEKRRNTDIYTLRGEANLYHGISNGELNVKAHWFYSERGLPGAVVLYNSKANERLWDEDVFVQASVRKQLSDRWQFCSRLKYAHTWNRYEDEDVKYQGGRQTETHRQNELYASGTLGWTACRGVTVALAEDLAFNNLRSSFQNPQQPKRYTSLTALTAKWSGKRISTTAGAIATYMTEDVEHGDKPGDRKRVSPTVSLSCRLTESELLYARAMYKGTFRVPTFNDMYYERVGTKALRPEKADEFNVGLTWLGRETGRVKQMSVTIDGYYNNVRDKIVAIPTMYVWKMSNYGKVRMYGINATMTTEIDMGGEMSLLLSGNYSMQRSEDITDKEAVFYKSQLPYTPKHTGNCSAVVSTRWLTVGYSVSGCGERFALVQNTPEYRIKGYWEHSVTLSREFALRDCRISLQATLANITNAQYEIIRYYPMPGRSWTLTGTITI